jgi:hypothetical protein
LLGNTMTQASAGESTPPGPPFASVHGRQFQLIKALFPAIALRRHLGETGLERYLPAITLRCHFCKLVLKHHQHLSATSARTRAATSSSTAVPDCTLGSVSTRSTRTGGALASTNRANSASSMANDPF